MDGIDGISGDEHEKMTVRTLVFVFVRIFCQCYIYLWLAWSVFCFFEQVVIINYVCAFEIKQ